MKKFIGSVFLLSFLLANSIFASSPDIIPWSKVNLRHLPYQLDQLVYGGNDLYQHPKKTKAMHKAIECIAPNTRNEFPRDLSFTVIREVLKTALQRSKAISFPEFGLYASAGFALCLLEQQYSAEKIDDMPRSDAVLRKVACACVLFIPAVGMYMLAHANATHAVRDINWRPVWEWETEDFLEKLDHYYPWLHASKDQGSRIKRILNI